MLSKFQENLDFPRLLRRISTGEFHRLGRRFIDWATAVASEADIDLTDVTSTYHGSGPIYKTSAQSMELSGIGFTI